MMLVGLKQPLKEGEAFPLDLDFEHAGPVSVEVEVEKSASHGEEADQHMARGARELGRG